MSHYHRHVFECSDCGMSLHISEKVCEFCGSKLRVDKLRHVFRHNIPYLSLMIVILLVAEMGLSLNHAQENLILFFDEFILVVFLLDIGLDKYLYRGQYKHFMRRRAVDILFVLPLLRTLKVFEAVPVLGRAFSGLHAMQHVPQVQAMVSFDVGKAGHIVKYAKYAYPAFLRR
ncbi:MAG: hypothetical protein ABIG84_02890 [archaeon]